MKRNRTRLLAGTIAFGLILTAVLAIREQFPARTGVSDKILNGDQEQPAKPDLGYDRAGMGSVISPNEFDQIANTRGITLPNLAKAGDAVLSDDTEVIGVILNGEARAYSILALSGGPGKHIVNDVVAGVPITVTYCDLNVFCRVVKSKDVSDEPLVLGCGGFIDRQLQILIDGVRYPQNSLHLPCEDQEFERTTWNQWKAAHPKTSVYEAFPE